MKKAMIIVALVTLGVMLMALPSEAAYFTIRTHGGFGTGGSNGCADCHTTHAADAAFLLAAGPTETDACYACHGASATASPYDVQNGAMSVDYNYSNSTRTTWSNGNIYPSYAGGFNKSFNFKDGVDNVGQNDAAQASVGANFIASDSAHNVEVPSAASIPGTAWNDGVVKIPGGSAIVTNNVFKCGSCHDPHGGAANTTARLLRTALPANAGPIAVYFDTAGAVDATTYRILSYPSSINTWCGGCHDYFNAPDKAGHIISTEGHYRHPMGIGVTGAITNSTISYGTPLSNDGGKLTCFSCHRAHGTAATVAGAAATFKRYNGDAGATASSSALLRLKGRDTCYNCHGAATSNTYSTYQAAGGGTHPAH